jgi:CheY-like chemotaxis protein
MRVVLADNHALVRQGIRVLLEKAGIEVAGEASDGQEALLLVAAIAPDVAILDIGMPRLNGHEVATRMRATDWGKGIVLIALTGWGQEQDQQAARAAGFNHHCTKPVDLEQLLRLVAGPA